MRRFPQRFFSTGGALSHARLFRLVLAVAAGHGLLAPPAARAEFLAEGARLEQLTDDGESWAWGWAPRGDFFAYVEVVSKTQSQLRVRNRDGSIDETVSPVGYPFYVQWSWKGDRIAFSYANAPEMESQAGIFIYDLESRKIQPISQPYPLRELLGFGGPRRRRSGSSSGRSRRGRSRGGSFSSSSSRSRPSGFGNGPRWSADDKFIAYGVSVGDERKDEVWVYDTEVGKLERLLSGRGEVRSQYWSPDLPNKIVLLVEAGNNNFDVATVNPDGTDLQLLTNIGSEDVDMNDATFSYTGDRIVYLSDIEMTLDEQDRGRRDVFTVLPDGTQTRNITQASTPDTEHQLGLFGVRWSWDGRWLMGGGNRYDQQGRSISARWLVDPHNGGYRVIATSQPEVDSESHRFRSWEWSYDSSKVVMTTERNSVRNWGSDTERFNRRSGIVVFDLTADALVDLIIFSEDDDRKEIVGRFSYTPDSRSVRVTIDEIVSVDEGISHPDVFLIHLPDSLIHPDAASHVGPPLGRPEAAPSLAAQAALRPAPTEIADADAPPSPVPPRPPPPSAELASRDQITVIVEPQHMLVSELKPLLPGDYTQYITEDTSRNLFVFSGPVDAYETLLSDIELLDFPPPLIMVDLLAIEMADEANRELGLDWTYAEGRFAFVQPEGLSIRDLTPGFDFFPPGGLPFVAPDSFSFQDFERFLNSNATLRGLSTFPGVGQGFYQGVGRIPDQFFVRLNNLEQDGKVTILANPRTVGTAGKDSHIQIRKTVSFFFSEGFDLTGRAIVQKSDATATTEGRITPTLLADGSIHMLVDVTIATLRFTEEGLPEITDRKATTEVTVAPGETIILGGLRQQELLIIETRTPILGSIPFLRAFFSKSSRQLRHSTLTILITPQVMGNGPTITELPDPKWPQLQWDDRYSTPIVEDKSLHDESKEPLTPEWLQKTWGGIKGFFGGGDGEATAEDERDLNARTSDEAAADSDLPLGEQAAPPVD